MDRDPAKAVLEAVLFAMGDSVEISRLADVIEEDLRTTKKILAELEADYANSGRGIEMVRFEDSVQLCTKADMYEYLIKIAKTPRKMVLTDTVIETLSIIAYKQPVTRVEIERVRGVSCDHAINKLLEYDDVVLEFTPEALQAAADRAVDRGIGARGLRAVLEEVMTRIMYDIPSDPSIVKVTVTEACVRNGSEPEIQRDPAHKKGEALQRPHAG